MAWRSMVVLRNGSMIASPRPLADERYSEDQMRPERAAKTLQEMTDGR